MRTKTGSGIGDYEYDRDYTERYIPAIKEIIALVLQPRIEVSSLVQDRKQATDLIVMQGRAKTGGGPRHIAARIRRFHFYKEFRQQFTIRSRRENERGGEIETELSKIERGFANWMIYGFGLGDHSVGYWNMLDLDVFRKEWAGNRRQLSYGERPNGDGTYFHWFNIASFSKELVIATGESEQILAVSSGTYIESTRLPTDWIAGEPTEKRQARIRANRIKTFEDGLPIIIAYQGEAYGEKLRAIFYDKLDSIVTIETKTGDPQGSMWWFAPKAS